MGEDCCCCCTWLLVLIPVAIFILKRYLKPGMFQADGPVMRDKTVIITGCNTGIGFETASELARYGAKVILACRDTSKAEQARQEIINRLKGQEGQQDIEQRLIVEDLDLTSFDNIRAFAERMQKLPKLDVLINNAGVAFLGERRLTKDGLELTMGTNHFGHFLLTDLLLPLLKRSAPSRIVVVSSRAHIRGKIEFDNLNSERSFGRRESYSNSKLANVLFTRELARRLESTGVVVNALHPGVIITEAGRHLPKYLLRIGSLFTYFLKTPLEGAQTTIFLAASNSAEALKSGLYFRECHEYPTAPHALDDAVGKKLWEVSERITKLA